MQSVRLQKFSSRGYWGGKI